MTLWVIPHIVWCVHGTGVSVRDIGLTVSRPLLSGVVAALLAFGVQMFYGQSLRPIARLALGGTVLFSAYLATLLYVMGQKALYLDLIRGFRRRSVVTDEVLASV